jgi:hypothetical protein
MLPNSVEDLRRALHKIEQAIGGAASKAPRAQILKTIAFLDEHVERSLEDLVAMLEAARPVPKPKIPKSTSTKPRTPKPKEPARLSVVRDYVQKLRSTEASLDDFAALMAAIKADKAVRMDEMKLIVADYSGDTSAFKSKPTGLGMIQRAFDARWALRQQIDPTLAAQ